MRKAMMNGYISGLRARLLGLALLWTISGFVTATATRSVNRDETIRSTRN
jgi:hypothetical protein